MKLIIQRQKRRNCFITLVTTFLRSIHIAYKLKFKWAKKRFHPIFVVVCRIVSTFLSLFKIWQNQNNLQKITTSGAEKDKEGKTISAVQIQKLKQYFDMGKKHQEQFKKHSSMASRDSMNNILQLKQELFSDDKSKIEVYDKKIYQMPSFKKG